MFNVDNCRFCIWGMKNTYYTHTHIHDAFYRALKGMGKDVVWYDHKDNLADVDFSNTMFISEHLVAQEGMPVRDDCFYTVHGMNDNRQCQAYLQKAPHKLGWGCYMTVNNFAGAVMLEPQVAYYPGRQRMEFMWATDLLPAEIEALKPTERLWLRNPIINWVGTVWHLNEPYLDEFARAAKECGVIFRPIGGGQATKGVFGNARHGDLNWTYPNTISIADNIRLIRESYMAPTISNAMQLDLGYYPCRIFKNISYGQPGLTNSAVVQQLFDDPVPFDADCYKLFYTARERLQDFTLEQMHRQMDFVAAKHTYVNRVNSILQAAKLTLED